MHILKVQAPLHNPQDLTSMMDNTKSQELNSTQLGNSQQEKHAVYYKTSSTGCSKSVPKYALLKQLKLTNFLQTSWFSNAAFSRMTTCPMVPKHLMAL